MSETTNIKLHDILLCNEAFSWDNTNPNKLNIISSHLRILKSCGFYGTIVTLPLALVFFTLAQCAAMPYWSILIPLGIAGGFFLMYLAARMLSKHCVSIEFQPDKLIVTKKLISEKHYTFSRDLNKTRFEKQSATNNNHSSLLTSTHMKDYFVAITNQASHQSVALFWLTSYVPGINDPTPEIEQTGSEIIAMLERMCAADEDVG